LGLSVTAVSAQSAENERGPLQEQAMCAAQAKKMATQNEFQTWVSHYNPTERRCYVLEAARSDVEIQFGV
jgi:hypothetical protein